MLRASVTLVGLSSTTWTVGDIGPQGTLLRWAQTKGVIGLQRLQELHVEEHPCGKTKRCKENLESQGTHA